MTVAVAYEDESLLIIDKPQGLPVTPGRGTGLCDELFAYRPDLLRVHGFKPGEGGLLNRLDNDTGGLVLFAKTDAGFGFYSDQMRLDRVKKTYLVVADGRPETRQGVIEAPLGHSRKSARRMLLAGAGRGIRGHALTARTVWRVLEYGARFTLLEVSITKGVRHQIRVHLSSIDCPIVGDRLYNRKGGATLAPFHRLYCFSVAFENPAGKEREVTINVPWGETWRGMESSGSDASAVPGEG
jgi:23S rRNA-/tRNA-specific pseudouridylate synthase